MATRGVNGAAAATLNARFIKCGGCNVNVPKEDMLALGKCTVCGRAYEPEATADGRGIAVETVAFEASSDAAAAASGGAESDSKPKRKRWAVLTSKKGRTYYHNSETGEDTWEKPHDLDAEAADDAFGTFAELVVIWSPSADVVLFMTMAISSLQERRGQERSAPRAGQGRGDAYGCPDGGDRCCAAAGAGE